MKLEVNFIGNPDLRALWTRRRSWSTQDMYRYENEKENTLVLIISSNNGRRIWDMVAIFPLGSDLTVSRISILPLDQQSLARIARMDEVYASWSSMKKERYREEER